MRRQLWAISEALIPRQPNVFDFNQALMDFGATVCSARAPKCAGCPMTAKCRSFPWKPKK
jgi:A/G-specific adenine glycosylase